MATATPIPDPKQIPVPRLENGDRLSRDEFERRYDADPSVKKAELIEGVVYRPSPVRLEQHGKQHFNLIGWLAHYVAGTPGVEGGDNTSLRLDLDNEPQPDTHLIIRPECGGQVEIDDQGYIVGAPELVGEVASSSVSYDLHAKLHVYRRNGVKEYAVWRVEEEAIDWFVLRHGRYERATDHDGVCRSEILPGLWLDAQAMLRHDLPADLAALEQGLRSDEHKAFVAKLSKEIR